jgi:FMN phosphatase YigB (HAD superfamily)
MPIKFIYFDMGNVLLYFDREIGFRALAEETGCPVDLVRQTILGSGELWRYEEGAVSGREFHEYYCRETNTRPDLERFHYLHSDIFEINVSIIPVVAGLAAAGYRLGILSNICEAHWEFCTNGRYAIISNLFEVRVASYLVGAMKPEPVIFNAARDQAGVAAEEIFFMDDTAGHVAGARRAGWDAVQYTTTDVLVDDLHARGIRFNY